MWFSIFKIWVSSVGDLRIRGDGNFDYDFFQFQRPWTIQERLAVFASEATLSVPTLRTIQRRLAQLD